MSVYRVQVILKDRSIIYAKIEAQSMSLAKAAAEAMFSGCRVGLITPAYPPQY